ncbi:1-aminocyclopropane-1-carboxylate deaminase [Flavobacteriaceae bacterium 3519-10]|nr:1-aminocyclopropane-1-carboxylate deaminase [Flavobacteriaceae bacterium 3519-10]
MIIPDTAIPIIELSLKKNIRLFIKREDLIHREISGNKYWKLFYNINNYRKLNPPKPMVITFGGAYSNHITAVSALGNEMQMRTFGIIRGEEIAQKWHENPSLSAAHSNGMELRFVTREAYRDKNTLTESLQKDFPQALIIPEGGTNEAAVEGIRHMLDEQTKSFDYLCTAVGTGGTLAGMSKFAEEHQKILGFKVVNDQSLNESVLRFSGRDNFKLINSHDGGYGKITDGNIRFINKFSEKYGIQLDPVYTGKMMKSLFELIEDDFFPDNCRILVFHTGGLQGIQGANERLKKQKRPLIKVIKS